MLSPVVVSPDKDSKQASNKRQLPSLRYSGSAPIIVVTIHSSITATAVSRRQKFSDLPRVERNSRTPRKTEIQKLAAKAFLEL